MPTWSILVNRLGGTDIRSSWQPEPLSGEPVRLGVPSFTFARDCPLVTVECPHRRRLRCFLPGFRGLVEEDNGMAGSVIVNGARTPMGRLLGSLKDFSGADLGG